MPEKEVVERAEEDLREGKSPSTAAGEFVHEEIEHVREGKHGAFATAGDRNRAKQGSPGRYPTCSSQGRENQKVDARERGARLPKRTIPGKNQDIG
jgi:hypothetical protein